MQPHTSFKRYFAALIVGGLITALLLFALPSYAAAHPEATTPTPSPTQPTPTSAASAPSPAQSIPTTTPPTPTPVPPTPTPASKLPAVTSICPPAQTTIAANEPAIDFCSPSFNKDIEGTTGAQVKVLVRNVFGQITGFYMVNKDYTLLSPIATFKLQCAIPNQLYCFSIPAAAYQENSTGRNLRGEFFLSFTWSFPQAHQGSNYYAVLTYRDQSNGQTENLIQSPSDKYTYTVHSTQPPCIAVLKESPATSLANCSFSQTNLTAGSPIHFYGANWVSGGHMTQEVDIKLSCSSCQGSPQSLTINVPEQVGLSTFNYPYTLPRTLSGTYQITATNRVVDTNHQAYALSQADGTLTFSSTGTTSSPNITIVQPCIQISVINTQQPTPTPPANCQRQKQSLSIPTGSDILIQGANWFLPPGEQALIQLCLPHTGCKNKQSTLSSMHVSVNTDGHFVQPEQLSPDIVGEFVLVVSVKDTKFFGEDTPDNLYTLSISSGSSGSPGTLPLLALLPAVISLLLYIITQRRRTMQAATATQRVSGGNSVPITPRASLTPPVTRQPPGRHWS